MTDGILEGARSGLRTGPLESLAMSRESDHPVVTGKAATPLEEGVIGYLVARKCAHDLRNSLGVIRNSIYLLRRRLVASELSLELADLIEDEVKSAEATIGRLLESSEPPESPKGDST